jgi:hypothetical protein
VFGLIHLTLFVLMAAMLISLVNTGAIFAWPLPPDLPVWAGALILLLAYQFVVSPVRAAGHWIWHPRREAAPAWFTFWNAVVWLVGMAVVLWIASKHLAEIREFLQNAPQVFRDFLHAIRDFFARQ